ncbi:hypothetical protein DUI87_19951 [Hirundo rustica rustica]|uniref:Uncharacterized protein n=1 Tax=Hirundo rustica rustica TaxID=333673 RepID=A0A3M0JR56_HIRRU|nr:hypothetical protein DUI87_19951 [Hirundo rustica rustica]
MDSNSTYLFWKDERLATDPRRQAVILLLCVDAPTLMDKMSSTIGPQSDINPNRTKIYPLPTASYQYHLYHLKQATIQYAGNSARIYPRKGKVQTGTLSEIPSTGTRGIAVQLQHGRHNPDGPVLLYIDTKSSDVPKVGTSVGRQDTFDKVIPTAFRPVMVQEELKCLLKTCSHKLAIDQQVYRGSNIFG